MRLIKSWTWNHNHNNYAAEPVASEKLKHFKNLQLCLVGSSWIQLIHLIIGIQHKIGKNTLSMDLEAE